MGLLVLSSAVQVPWGLELTNYIFVQAFKIIVTDPDSVLDSLTREIKEVGPNGQEVDYATTC